MLNSQIVSALGQNRFGSVWVGFMLLSVTSGWVCVLLSRRVRIPEFYAEPTRGVVVILEPSNGVIEHNYQWLDSDDTCKKKRLAPSLTFPFLVSNSC